MLQNQGRQVTASKILISRFVDSNCYYGEQKDLHNWYGAVLHLQPHHIESVSCPDIWNQEPANPVNHHQDRHLKRRFAGQSRSSPPRPSPKPQLRRHMLTSLLPPPRRPRAGPGGLGCDAATRGCGRGSEAPAAALPAATAAAAGGKGGDRGRGGAGKSTRG